MRALMVAPVPAPPAPPVWPVPPGGAAQLIALFAAQWAAEAATDPAWVQSVDPEVDGILVAAAEEAAAEAAMEEEDGMELEDLEADLVESDAESGVTSASD